MHGRRNRLGTLPLLLECAATGVSFRCGRSLGHLTQPTVGRHIASLEKALGLPLFTRSQTGLLPTEAALALRSYAESMSSTVAALRRAAESQGAGVQGAVRISASEVIGGEVLPHVLARLRKDHPNLAIELVLTNRVQDLLRREADIAVRMAPPKQGALVAKRVSPIILGLHAHQSYLAHSGMPTKGSDLQRHSLMASMEETPFRRVCRRRACQSGLVRCSRCGPNSDLGELALIRAGCGIGVCQVGIAKRDPSLVRVLPRQSSSSWRPG